MTVLGTPRLHLLSTDSTNVRARELAAAGAVHGTLVTADAQTAARGRQGRAWTTPPGRALSMSMVLRRLGPLASLAAGAALAGVVDELAPGERPTQIKWPNDVLRDGRKVAGILLEGRPQHGWWVLGIGVNVATRSDDLPPELRERAGSLGLPVAAREQVLEVLLDALGRWLDADDSQVLGAVRARDALRGRPVSWAQGAGRGAGIDDEGRLRVDTGAGVVSLDAGEVHLGVAASQLGETSSTGTS